MKIIFKEQLDRQHNDYWVADPSETNSPPEEISIQLETLEKTEVENKNGEYNDIDNNGHQTQN
jgi:hypothetical protein